MKKIYLLLVFTILALLALAHEYILLAAHYRIKKGDELEMHLFVADGFNIQMERPFQKEKIRKFELVTADSIVDLTKEIYTLPIVNRKVAFTGGGLFHLERDYSHIELATPKFLAYLKEDHMEYILPKVDGLKKF